MISRPKIISTARMNSTNEPATAKDAVLMPNTLNSASPAKKKAKKSANAVKQASAARMGWLFSLRVRKIGMEPKMSMMAAITKKELKISMKLRVPITDYCCF